MATQLKKTVKPSGGDYTSLEACMNANEQNLVTADKYFDVEIDGTWSSADTTAVTIHNYTTDATRYINIYTTSTARHSGKWSTSAYRLVVNWGSPLTGVDYVINVDGLQVELTGGTDGYSLLNFGGGNYYNAGGTIKNNILRSSISSTNRNLYGIVCDVYGTHYIYNNIIYGLNGQSGGTAGIVTGIKSTKYVYNNTIYNCRRGISSGGNIVAKNNICQSNDEGDYYGTFSSSSTHNLASDTTTPEYGTYYDSKTLTFVSTTYASADFHLASTDTDAIDKGTDLSGTFTTDIDGTTRSGTWDIGADEYVATGGGSNVFMSTNKGWF